MIQNLLKTATNKVVSRKLAVTVAAGAAASTGVVDVTWPMAAIVCTYVLGQAYVDANN